MRVKKSHDVIKKRCEKHEVSEEDNSVKCEKKKCDTRINGPLLGPECSTRNCAYFLFFNNSGTK